MIALLLWACSASSPGADSGGDAGAAAADSGDDNPDSLLFWGQVGEGRSLDGQCGPDTAAADWLRSVSWSATGEADVALRCAHGGDSVLLHLSAPRPGQREGKRVTAMLQLTWEGPEGSLQPGAAWRSRADLERVEALVGGDLRLAGDIDLEAAERHLHSSFDLLVPCVSGC